MPPRRRGRKAEAGGPETVRVRVLTEIVGTEWSARRGGFVSVQKPAAERLVARGLAEYALSPVERAVQIVAERGGGIALPKKPDAELQAAALSQGVATTEM